MSEWNDDQFSGPDRKVNDGRPVSGSWDVVLTIVALLATSAVAFLVAYLTRDNQSRPFWLLGLGFSAPVAALMGSVLLKEKAMPSMTPSSSRTAQAVLALGSVLAAAVVGCFCQVSNTRAGLVTEEIKGEKSDVLIILDKSGSMNADNRDKYATEAVTHLVKNMSSGSQVGLLIDVGWRENNSGSDVVPLEKRKLAIAPLSDTHRKKILDLAAFPTKYNENFPCAFDAALDMIREYPGDTHSLSIMILSDGDDCTYRFRAADYQDQLNSFGVSVNYLYVCEPYSTEMDALAKATGGSSIYVENISELEDQMKSVAVTTFTDVKTTYKDALRDIDDSDTAKAVTGILLLLEGLLIGLSLTIMLSLQKQKRFQLILSPLCAILAFLLLSFGQDIIPTPWIREGTAFSLLGLVFMRGNLGAGAGKSVRYTDSPDDASDQFYAADTW